MVDALVEDDVSRTNFLKACLSKLGLIVSQENTSVPSLSCLHLSSLNHKEVPALMESWQDIIVKEDGEEYIKGENDTFHIERPDMRWSVGSLVKALPETSVDSDTQGKADQLGGIGAEDRVLDYSTIVKLLIPHPTNWPGNKETPYFNHHAFYANLRKYQEEQSGEAREFGKTLLYGEVVTSTNTLLEKCDTLFAPVCNKMGY